MAKIVAGLLEPNAMFSPPVDDFGYPQSAIRVKGSRPVESVCEKATPFDPVELGSADFHAAARFKVGENVNVPRPTDVRASLINPSICCSPGVIPASFVSQLVSAFAVAGPLMPHAKSVSAPSTTPAIAIIPIRRKRNSHTRSPAHVKAP